MSASADLDFAHELADIAASVTLRSFGDRLPFELKADDSPVTEVDLAAEQAIRKAIGARYPTDGVHGEEEGLEEGTSGRAWIVDPVDGTKLYAEGIPLWTTLIALQEDGEVVLGVADAPALGERYHATRGDGAWRGGRQLAVSRVDVVAEALIAHSPVEDWIDDGALARVASQARATRGLSDAWGQLLVAQGSVDALVEHEPCFLWDWAATSVIVHEAGGRMTTIDGGPPTQGMDLIVSNGRVHDELMRALERGGTDGT